MSEDSETDAMAESATTRESEEYDRNGSEDHGRDGSESTLAEEHTRLGDVFGLGDSAGFDLPDLGPDPPSVSIPDPSDVDVPREVERAFWSLVITVNLAVLGVCLGAMLVGFRGEWRLGGGLVALGVVLFVRAGYRYRRYRDQPTPMPTEN